MEEGSKLVEQSDMVEAQEEVSAPRSVEGSTVPIPQVQIAAQVA